MDGSSFGFDLDDRAVLELTGDDCLEWLQGQATNDVRGLADGLSLSFCFCQPTGQLLAVVDAWAFEDRIVMSTARECVGAVLERVERMTILEDVAAMGRIIKAVHSGRAQLKIEVEPAEKQARIDSGKDVIVGVNKYKLGKEDAISTLDIDNVMVRDNQIARLKAVRAARDPAKTQAALDALTRCAETGDGNLLDLSVKAMRLRATVGEISDALEGVFGRHRADTQMVTGVYSAIYDSAEGWDKLKAEIANFAEEQGRRPRVMIAKLGQDGHDRGAKVVATAFADLGYDVDMGPLFQTAEECARQAIENDVHAVGVSTLAAGHKTLVPAIIESLRAQGADDIIVFVGGVIPRQDYDMLYDAGVKGIYGPGTPIPASAKDVLEQIRKAVAS